MSGRKMVDVTDMVVQIQKHLSETDYRAVPAGVDLREIAAFVSEVVGRGPASVTEGYKGVLSQIAILSTIMFKMSVVRAGRNSNPRKISARATEILDMRISAFDDHEDYAERLISFVNDVLSDDIGILVLAQMEEDGHSYIIKEQYDTMAAREGINEIRKTRFLEMVYEYIDERAWAIKMRAVRESEAIGNVLNVLDDLEEIEAKLEEHGLDIDEDDGLENLFSSFDKPWNQ
jgi:hypothetical protein